MTIGRGALSMCTPWRAYAYSGLPRCLTAEKAGGACHCSPAWAARQASMAAWSSTGTGAVAVMAPSGSRVSVSTPSCSRAR